MALSEEYLSANGLINYPFARDLTINESVRHAIVDAVISIYPGTEHNSFLKTFSYTKSSNVVSLVVSVDGTAYTLNRSVAVQDKYVIAYSITVPVRFVLDVDFIKSLPNTTLTGLSYSFDDSVYSEECDGITSISIYNGSPSGTPIATVSGDIKLKPGHNIEFSGSDDSELEISATPGAGLGVVPCVNPPDCSAPPLNIEDNAMIVGDGCFFIYTLNNVIHISGKCKPCCVCEDYRDVFYHEKSIANSLVPIRNRLFNTISPKYNTDALAFDKTSHIPSLDVRVSIWTDAPEKFSASGKKMSDTASISVALSIINTNAAPTMVYLPKNNTFVVSAGTSGTASVLPTDVKWTRNGFSYREDTDTPSRVAYFPRYNSSSNQLTEESLPTYWVSSGNSFRDLSRDPNRVSLWPTPDDIYNGTNVSGNHGMKTDRCSNEHASSSSKQFGMNLDPGETLSITATWIVRNVKTFYNPYTGGSITATVQNIKFLCKQYVKYTRTHSWTLIYNSIRSGQTTGKTVTLNLPGLSNVGS